MNSVKLLGLSALLLLGSGVLFGCSSAMMQTPRQLDAGEVAFSASLDMPGHFFIVPRMGAQVTAGVGGAADVSAMVATTVFINEVGVGLRAYPSDDTIFGLQAAGVFDLYDREGLIKGALVARLGSAVTESRFFYGGGMVTALYFPTSYYNEFWSVSGSADGYNISLGGYGGVDLPVGDFASFQFETQMKFIGHDTRADRQLVPLGLSEEFFVQISLGMTFWPGRREAAGPVVIDPTPDAEPRRRDRASDGDEPREGREERREREPRWGDEDDDGVPLY